MVGGCAFNLSTTNERQAATAIGIAAALGNGVLRKRAYEVFKTGHVVFAAVFLAAYYEYVVNG